MKYLPIIVVALTMSVLGVAISTSRPTNANAMTEAESQMLFTIIRRVQNIEKMSKVVVPEELKFYMNCSQNQQQAGGCQKE